MFTFAVAFEKFHQGYNGKEHNTYRQVQIRHTSRALVVQNRVLSVNDTARRVCLMGWNLNTI